MTRIKILQQNEPTCQLVDFHHLSLMLVRVFPADSHRGKTGVKRDCFQAKSMARLGVDEFVADHGLRGTLPGFDGRGISSKHDAGRMKLKVLTQMRVPEPASVKDGRGFDGARGNHDDIRFARSFPNLT